MDRSKVLNWSYSWAMHDFQKSILLAFAALSLLATAIAARAQTQPNSVATNASAPSSTGSAQGTQALGYWVDPATKLMWTAKDNDKDVSWKGAVKYCRVLRLAGYSDWRLATLAELGTIYDRNANVPGLFGSGKDNLFTWHVKGNLFLTGDEWSGERSYDDRGHPSDYAYYFDFNEGQPRDDPIGWPYSFANSRALCVRGSAK